MRGAEKNGAPTGLQQRTFCARPRPSQHVAATLHMPLQNSLRQGHLIKLTVLCRDKERDQRQRGLSAALSADRTNPADQQQTPHAHPADTGIPANPATRKPRNPPANPTDRANKSHTGGGGGGGGAATRDTAPYLDFSFHHRVLACRRRESVQGPLEEYPATFRLGSLRLLPDK